MSQGLSPLPKPCYSQQLAMPPDPGSCLVAGFPPCPQRGSMMSPPPSASPKLHDLSSAPYSKGMASPGHSHLGLQRPAGGVLAVQEAPRPVGVHPGSPQQPPPALLQPQSCSPTRPSVMGHQQHPPPKVPRNESAATQPLPLPEVREDSNHSLAPIPVTVKREPQELDQLYLDDGRPSGTRQVQEPIPRGFRGRRRMGLASSFVQTLWLHLLLTMRVQDAKTSHQIF
nr:PREDICTED: nuclear factor of activated T-cells, cytoplasmic 1-like isoform X2 [Equus przewalskii]